MQTSAQLGSNACRLLDELSCVASSSSCRVVLSSCRLVGIRPRDNFSRTSPASGNPGVFSTFDSNEINRRDEYETDLRRKQTVFMSKRRIVTRCSMSGSNNAMSGVNEANEILMRKLQLAGWMFAAHSAMSIHSIIRVHRSSYSWMTSYALPPGGNQCHRATHSN